MKPGIGFCIYSYTNDYGPCLYVKPFFFLLNIGSYRNSSKDDAYFIVLSFWPLTKYGSVYLNRCVAAVHLYPPLNCYVLGFKHHSCPPPLLQQNFLSIFNTLNICTLRYQRIWFTSNNALSSKCKCTVVNQWQSLAYLVCVCKEVLLYPGDKGN